MSTQHCPRCGHRQKRPRPVAPRTIAEWHAGVALTVAAATLALAALAFATWGIWTSDDRGALAFLFGFAAFGCGAFGLGLLEGGPPPLLSHEARRHLRAERERIELARLIAEAEKEAGLS